MPSNPEIYRRAFDSSTNAIVLFDACTGRIIEGNPAALELYGYAAAEFVALEINHLCQGPGAGEPSELEAVPLLTSHLHKDGTPLPVDVSIGSFALDGSQIGIMIVTDLRERRRIEAEREALMSRLINAQKMEAIGRMASGVAHDFNNMLSIITLHCDLLVKKLNDGIAIDEALHDIKVASQRAASLTGQLLTLGRKQTTCTSLFDLGQTIREVVSLVQQTLKRSISLQTEVCPAPHIVKADPNQLSQVLLNLVLNARDALPQGGKIVISLRPAQKSEVAIARPGIERWRSFALLAVSDDGMGMSEEVKSKVCEPFFTTKPKGEGSGLGLAMAYAIVAQAAGDLIIDSKPGRGTRVSILLPLVEQGTP